MGSSWAVNSSKIQENSRKSKKAVVLEPHCIQMFCAVSCSSRIDVSLPSQVEEGGEHDEHSRTHA